MHVRHRGLQGEGPPSPSPLAIINSSTRTDAAGMVWSRAARGAAAASAAAAETGAAETCSETVQVAVEVAAGTDSSIAAAAGLSIDRSS